MAKLLTLAILAALVAIPTFAARKRGARHGLALAFLWLVVAAAAYLLVLREVPPPR